MGMGSGKSKVTVDLLANIGWVQHALILCPKSVIGVWRREFAKWCGVEVDVLCLDKGTSKRKAQDLSRFRYETQGRLSVVVVNYESAWRSDLGKLIQSVSWDAVVLDESHRVKSPGGKASRFVAKLGRVTPFRLCLTGTPMPHSPLDLYGQFRFLDPTVFGTNFTAFRSRYALCHPEFKSKVLKWLNEEELSKKLADNSYTCKSEDVLDLPPIRHERRYVELTGKTRRHYVELEKELITEVQSGVVEPANAMVELLRLQQLTSGFLTGRNPDGTKWEERVGGEKKQAVRDIIEDADGPVVVFCRFTPDVQAVREIAAACGKSHGEISGSQKDLTEHATMPDDIDVMAVQIQSGGVGIDLTRASIGVFYSVGFSLGDYEQAVARIHRPGQERPTMIYHLLASDTVDDKVYEALESKRDVIDSVLKDYEEEVL